MGNKYAKQSREARAAYRRHRECDRKKRFPTQADAESGAGGQRVYKCPHCDGWHRSAAFQTLVNTQRNRMEKRGGM